jgi:hypothetical protein
MASRYLAATATETLMWGTYAIFAATILVAGLLMRARLRAAREARKHAPADFPTVASRVGVAGAMLSFLVSAILLFRAAPDDPNSHHVRQLSDCRTFQRSAMIAAIGRGDSRAASAAGEALAMCGEWRTEWDGAQLAAAGGAAIGGVVLLLLTAMVPRRET